MKRFIMAALMSVALNITAGQVQANQKAKTPAERQEMVQKKVEKLTKELNLTSEQQSQVRTVIQNKMDKKQQIMDEANTQIRSILTPAQVSKYNDLTD